MRIDIIKTKLKIIEENIILVKENFPDELEEFKKLGLIKDGIYKRIEASIQEIINICSIINTDLKIGIPSNRDEIISALEENEVISKELSEKIKQLKGFRNFLVHRYGRIQDDIAYEDIKKGFNDFKLFKNEIIKFLTSLEREDNSQTKL
jgi:uncharacterized protein YutE (UPF0331/DUF86 family)